MYVRAKQWLIFTYYFSRKLPCIKHTAGHMSLTTTLEYYCHMQRPLSSVEHIHLVWHMSNTAVLLLVTDLSITVTVTHSQQK